MSFFFIKNFGGGDIAIIAIYIQKSDKHPYSVGGGGEKALEHAAHSALLSEKCFFCDSPESPDSPDKLVFGFNL